MKNRIEYFDHTPKRDFIDCRITNMRDYFGYYGLKLDSCDLFILGQVEECSTMKYRVKEDSALELMLLGGCNIHFEETLFTNLGIEYETLQTANPEEIKDLIVRMIDREEPVYSLVDIRYLLNPDYQRKPFEVHCVSSVLVCGYEFEEQDYVLLQMKDDRNSPLMRVSFEAYIRAISSKLYPESPEWRFYRPKIEAQTIEKIETNYKSEIRTCLKSLCDRMLNGGEKVWDNGSKYNTLQFGLDVLEDVIKRNEEICALRQEEIREKILRFHLRSLRDMMVTGSNYFYRTEFAESLYSIAGKLNMDELGKTGDRMQTIAKKWRKLSRLFYLKNYFIVKTDICKQAAQINLQMSEILRNEKEIYEELSTCLN